MNKKGIAIKAIPERTKAKAPNGAIDMKYTLRPGKLKDFWDYVYCKPLKNTGYSRLSKESIRYNKTAFLMLSNFHCKRKFSGPEKDTARIDRIPNRHKKTTKRAVKYLQCKNELFQISKDTVKFNAKRSARPVNQWLLYQAIKSFEFALYTQFLIFLAYRPRKQPLQAITVRDIAKAMAIEYQAAQGFYGFLKEKLNNGEINLKRLQSIVFFSSHPFYAQCLGRRIRPAGIDIDAMLGFNGSKFPRKFPCFDFVHAERISKILSNSCISLSAGSKNAEATGVAGFETIGAVLDRIATRRNFSAYCKYAESQPISVIRWQKQFSAFQEKTKLEGIDLMKAWSIYLLKNAPNFAKKGNFKKK